MGLRLANDIAPDMYNYGHFQVLFDDGSLGWYEAGWGPMMSDTAFFVKDVVSPNGAVSIRMPESAKSDDRRHPHQDLDHLRVHRVGQGPTKTSRWPMSRGIRTCASVSKPSWRARSRKTST